MSGSGEDLVSQLSNPSQAPSKASIGKLAALLERQEIDIDEIGEIKRISIYQSLTKDADGEATIHDLAAIQISPAWEGGPKWPVVQPGPALRVPKKVPAEKKASDLKTCVVLPDMQIGFFRNLDGDLEATHDDRAIDVAIAIIKAVKPDKVVLVGDNLDLPNMSKYRLSPAYQMTTQASIDAATVICARLRTAAPSADITWIAGNHEERLSNFILDNAVAAFGLKRGNAPDSWPVLSVPNLCNLDDFSIDYLAGYPASCVWINQHIRVIHGDLVRSNGSTAHAYLSRETRSVVYGHIHRREWAEVTKEDYDGSKTVMAVSPGCLARVDGAVPSTKGGTDLDGRPMTVVENWQQGLAVVRYEDGDGRYTMEMVGIEDGWALYHGKEYSSEG